MSERGRDEALRLFGLKEAAELLGTDWREVRAWVDAGDLPCVRVGTTREPRVSVAMLLAWQEAIAAKITRQIARDQSPQDTPSHPSGAVREGESECLN